MNNYIVKHNNEYIEYDSYYDIPIQSGMQIFKLMHYEKEELDLNLENPMYKENPYKNNIWAIKRKTGLSNKQLEKLTGICYGTIAAYDRQERVIKEEHKKLIEKATECSVNCFY